MIGCQRHGAHLFLNAFSVDPGGLADDEAAEISDCLDTDFAGDVGDHRRHRAIGVATDPRLFLKRDAAPTAGERRGFLSSPLPGPRADAPYGRASIGDRKNRAVQAK